MPDDKVSILIPVFNAVDRVLPLLASIDQSKCHDVIEEILIGNDASDNKTSELLERAARKNQRVRVLTRKQNVGYLQNVNHLVEKSKTDLNVLLNSDTLVPPGWLLRILECFASDEEIALATPLSTNANHVTIRPTFGQSWRDLDSAIRFSKPNYPDSPTAVGCALAFKRSLIQRKPLLDEAYGTGYWEDTDLHFFVKSSGKRSVIIDNLVIFHGNGSSSFSIAHDLPAINDANRSVFMSKWGREYQRETREFIAAAPLARLRNEQSLICRYGVSDDLEVLFILPTLRSSTGGIAVVVKLVENLIERGVRAAIFVWNRPDWEYVNWLGSFRPFTHLDQLKVSISSVRLVIATSWDSFDWARDVAAIFDSKVFYFVQGQKLLSITELPR